MVILTGSKDLDEFMGSYGNFITTIYGKAATGKTTMMFLVSILVARNNKKTIFIDTENSFNVERFKQLAGSDYKELLENIFVIKIKSFKDQQLRIRSLIKLIEIEKVSLIVIDSLGYYYRRLRNSKSELANSMLISQMRILERLSKKVPVLIANQVYSSMDNDVRPVGGNIIFKFSSMLIKLENEPRKIKVIKPKEKEMLFEIKERGIFKK